MSDSNKFHLSEGDLEETFARSSGPGGQNVNKVSTAVTLRHRPSGLSVTVQDSRSQAMNRKLARARIGDARAQAMNRKRARERLSEAIESEQRQRRAEQKARQEKVRRQNRPRPRALKK